MLAIPTITEFKIIETEQGDTFIKYPNGLLEIYFSRDLDFIFYGSTLTFGYLYISRNIIIPNYISLIKGIYINAICDSNGSDVSVQSINIHNFMINPKVIETFYVVANENAFSHKLIHFHVVGYWK